MFESLQSPEETKVSSASCKNIIEKNELGTAREEKLRVSWNEIKRISRYDPVPRSDNGLKRRQFFIVIGSIIPLVATSFPRRASNVSAYVQEETNAGSRRKRTP